MTAIKAISICVFLSLSFVQGAAAADAWDVLGADSEKMYKMGEDLSVAVNRILFAKTSGVEQTLNNLNEVHALQDVNDCLSKLGDGIGALFSHKRLYSMVTDSRLSTAATQVVEEERRHRLRQIDLCLGFIEGKISVVRDQDASRLVLAARDTVKEIAPHIRALRFSVVGQ